SGETNTDVLRPYGVFAVISPFNFPAALAINMAGAALIAGNTVVLKPTEEAPRTGAILGEIGRDTLPPGVLNVLHGGPATGAALVDGEVDGVAFTGSAEVGRAIARQMQAGPFARAPLTREELFLPFVTVTQVDGLGEAIVEANAPAYGLTAGIFTEDETEGARFLDEIEAGVVYVNRRAGATTGAWPGTQTFCGWKSSGATGKGGLGPYYLPQFMREQSRTVVG